MRRGCRRPRWPACYAPGRRDIFVMSNELRQNSTLSPVQAQVAAALASGQSISAAAVAAGVHRSTVHNWLKSDANFQAEFDKIRQERFHDLYDQMLDLDTLALDTIRQILADPATPPSVRLRAALAVVSRPKEPRKIWNLPFICSPHDKAPAPPAPEIPRNAPCPCGSGDKYKRCCGKNAPPVLGKAA